VPAVPTPSTSRPTPPSPATPPPATQTPSASVLAPAKVTVRFFAGARAAAGGVSSEPAEAHSLDELVQLLTDRHGERLGVVLKAASFLVDGLSCHDRHAALPSAATIDVLPPFAGG
jgi:molybdopterin synthase sulfur carrier subunit